MVYPFVAGTIDIELRAERPGIGLLFGALVNQFPKLPVDRLSAGVGLDKVLLYFGSDRFEQISEVSEDGVDPEQGMAALEHVVAAKGDQRDGDKPERAQRGPHKR